MMSGRSFKILAVVLGMAALGALPIPALAQDGPKYPGYTGSYALLIGVSQYDHKFWRPLPNVPGYLDDIRQALISKGFEVEVVSDPTNSELRQVLKHFMMTYGGTWPDNRLMIYFMGHGHALRNADIGRYEGYIVSRDDAPVSSPQGKFKFLKEAVPMTKLWELARFIEAKHTLFILDADFSGHAIPGEKADPLLPPDPERVVRVITSGDASQRVPAKSIFTELLVEAITTARADKDGDGLLTGTELGYFLIREVTRASGGHQTPATSQLFGEGEFVFRVPRENP